MKKIIVIIVLAILVGFATYKLFFQYQQSTPQELTAAFSKAVKIANELQAHNPYKDEKEALVQWEIETSSSSITFRQHPSWDYHYADEYKQHVILSFKGDKIIMNQFESANYTRGSVSTFGFGYDKFREYKNAQDFLEKFAEFAKDLSKFKTGEYSYQSLVLSDYYPSCTWRNWRLSAHDNEKGYKYPY